MHPLDNEALKLGAKAVRRRRLDAENRQDFISLLGRVVVILLLSLIHIWPAKGSPTRGAVTAKPVTERFTTGSGCWGLNLSVIIADARCHLP